jgi:hypothetical protein
MLTDARTAAQARYDTLDEGPRADPTFVAELFAVPVWRILSPDRTRDVSAARIVMMGLLDAHGHDRQAIGRMLARDHSTVAHGIDRAHSHHKEALDRAKAARGLPATVPAPPVRVPIAWTPREQAHAIERALTSELPPPQGSYVAAYLLRDVTHLLTGRGAMIASLGLALIAAHPALEQRCAQLLADVDLPQYRWTLAEHVKRMRR